MSKTIEALQNGHTIMFNSLQPRYYRMVNGVIYFSDKNEDYTQWKKSNAKMCVFKNDVQWTIL